MRWYRVAGRHALPWRLTRDPYAVLIAEVMLQQTQVDRVLPYYLAWLGRWPTPGSLAQASIGDVIRAWGGLGYNRRAVFILDRQGIVRFRQIIDRGIPEIEQLLNVVRRLAQGP